MENLEKILNRKKDVLKKYNNDKTNPLLEKELFLIMKDELTTRSSLILPSGKVGDIFAYCFECNFYITGLTLMENIPISDYKNYVIAYGIEDNINTPYTFYEMIGSSSLDYYTNKKNNHESENSKSLDKIRNKVYSQNKTSLL